MNLPKWLVIVGIAIIVLGVLACGIGAGRALTESPPSSDTPPDSGKDWIPVGVVPAEDVRGESGCTTANGPPKQFTGANCTLVVDPNALQPRDLKLLVVTGSGTMTVLQEIRGQVPPSSKGFVMNQPLKIRVSGTTPVRAWFLCSSACTLRVITS